MIKNGIVKKAVCDKWVWKVDTTENIDTSNFVKKGDHNAKIIEIEKKMSDHNEYIATNNFNKFSNEMIDERLT